MIGWHTNVKSKRISIFHADMPGFAFNITILWDPQRWYRLALERIRQINIVKEGFKVSRLFLFIYIVGMLTNSVAYAY